VLRRKVPRKSVRLDWLLNASDGRLSYWVSKPSDCTLLSQSCWLHKRQSENLNGQFLKADSVYGRKASCLQKWQGNFKLHKRWEFRWLADYGPLKEVSAPCSYVSSDIVRNTRKTLNTLHICCLYASRLTKISESSCICSKSKLVPVGDRGGP
jgi:hypothetical protein